MKRGILLLGLLVAVAGANGCSSSTRGPDNHGQQKSKPEVVQIDAGQTLTTDFGQGAGVFVEYQPGGHWKLWTSCDTNVTGQGCRYQLNVRPRGTLGTVEGVDLESGDYFERYDDGSVSFFSDTDHGSDAIQFDVTPGEAISAELIIDGVVDGSFFVWVSDGQVVDGAAGNPVVFMPTAP